MQMRRSYDVPPPRMEDDHPYWHGTDRRYVNIHTFVLLLLWWLAPKIFSSWRVESHISFHHLLPCPHRYKQLSEGQLEASRAESLKDAADRIVPFFESIIVPAMRAGMKCLVVSHANTIRTLVKYLDRVSSSCVISSRTHTSHYCPIDFSFLLFPPKDYR